MLFDPCPFSTSVCLYSVLIQLDYTTTTYPLLRRGVVSLSVLTPPQYGRLDRKAGGSCSSVNKGVVISTYYAYWTYTSDTSILFYLTRNTCRFLQYFSNFSLVYKIFSQSRDCPVDVYLCLQYITHLSYKDICQILFHNFGT